MDCREPEQNLPRRDALCDDGRFKFRCRDSHNRLSQTTGPDGDPLQLLLPGRTEIWHFDLHNILMAHVYVVTGIPLEKIDGNALLSDVTRRLGAHYVFLYVREDPWF